MTPAELEDLRLRVRAFVDDELIPLEPPVVDGASPAPDVLAALRSRVRDLGLWSLGAPKVYGGQELSTYELCVLVEEMNRTTITGGFLGAGVFGEIAPNLLTFVGTEDQCERYLRPVIEDGRSYFFAMSEPDAGSDPSRMTTTAVRRDDGTWVIDGRKGLISSVHGADHGYVFTRTDDGPTCFIVGMDNPGVAYEEAPAAFNGTRVGHLTFTDCVVADHDILGAVGQGFGLGQRWLGQMRTIYYGAGVLGMAARSLDLAVAHAKTRSTFGAPLAERQGVQFMLADSAAELTQARLLVHDTARRLDAGEQARSQVAMTKVVGTETGARIIDRCLQIHGGLGLTSAYPFEQFLRTTRVWRITEGANEVHRWFIARELLR